MPADKRRSDSIRPASSAAAPDAFTEALRKADFDDIHEAEANRRIHASIVRAFLTRPDWLEGKCRFLLEAFPRLARGAETARYIWFQILIERAEDQEAPVEQRDEALWAALEVIRVFPEFLDHNKRTRLEKNPMAGRIMIQGKAGEWVDPFSDFRKESPLLILRTAWEAGGYGESVTREVEEYLAPSGALKRSDPEQLEVSIDGRSVKWGDEKYTFTASQGAVVRRLYDERQKGTPEVSHAHLLAEAESGCDRLRDVFKTTEDGKRAWGKLILTHPTTRKGTARLAP